MAQDNIIKTKLPVAAIFDPKVKGQKTELQKRWAEKPYWKGKFNFWNAVYLITSPLVAVVGTSLYIYFNGFRWVDLIIFVVFSWLTGLSITAGYHRYFSHRTYECRKLLQWVYLFFGAAAFENSALVWSSNHRYHHRYVDTEGDPYNIKKGFFWAHMGWIFFGDPEGRTFDNVPYLLKDKAVMLQHKYYLPLAFSVSLGLPTLIGWYFGRPMAGFFWGGWLRMVLVNHATFLINSAAHKFGTLPHGAESTARNCWWLAFFTFGEGYHNFHHTYASDYRNGYRWYQWDPSKWFIYTMSIVGVASRLTRVPDVRSHTGREA